MQRPWPPPSPAPTVRGCFDVLKHMFLLSRPGPPEPPKIGRKWGPRAPRISSDCPRKSLDFEIAMGDRLGTLRVSRSKRLFLEDVGAKALDTAGPSTHGPWLHFGLVMFFKRF